MFNFSILVVIIAALLVIHKVYCTESLKNFKLTVIRGGAKPSKQAYSSAKSKKSKAKQYEAEDDEDDDDDDEDDDDDDDRPVIRKKQVNSKSSSKTSCSASKSKKSSGGGKNKQRLDLVPAKRGKQSKKPSGFQLPAIPNLNFREKLDDLTKSSQSIYKDVYRRAKVMRSSPFEGMLLKATWPGNEPIAPELLNEIIRHSIPAFKYGSSSNAEDDPYHMTLHKLWTKMCEKDWRVVVKSTFILHCISRDSSADTCEKFASAIKSMSKHRNPKKPNHKYFNIRMMTELDAISQTYQSFISAYATHVLYRAKNFIGKFDDLKQLPDDAKLKLVVSKLQKAKQCILNGLECTAIRKDHAKPVLGQAVKSVALDLRELWKFFSSKVPLLLSYEAASSATPVSVTPTTTSTLSSSDESTTSTTTSTFKPTPTSTTSSTVSPANAALQAEIAELLTFYKETENKIQDYLLSAAKTFGKLKMKIPTDLDNDEVDMGQVNQKVTQLMNSISGGASKSSNAVSKKSSSNSKSAKKISKSIDEDDDDEEDEEEEDEEEDEEDDEDEEEEEEEEEESSAEDEEENDDGTDTDADENDDEEDDDTESKASGDEEDEENDDEDDSSNNEDEETEDDDDEDD